MDFSVSGITTLYTYPPKAECVGRISLRGQRRLIWVDTLRRCHYVGFLTGRLIWRDNILTVPGCTWGSNRVGYIGSNETLETPSQLESHVTTEALLLDVDGNQSCLK